MIFDQLSNAAQYTALHPLFAEGFRFINDLPSGAAPGRYELSGGAYALVQEYETKPVEGAKYEAHRKFIDIQYLFSGEELCFYAPLSQMTAEPYLPEKDYVGLTGEGFALPLKAGEFAIFYPRDAHLPSRMTGAGPRPVKKVVVKIPVP
jgi:YhcH/YjgK/YiaL family protein